MIRARINRLIMGNFGDCKSVGDAVYELINFWPKESGRTILGEKISKLTKNYRENLLKDLKDPIESAEYLNAALQDGDQEIFLMALRDVAEARGFTKLAKQTLLNRENLYRMLSDEGNPKLSSLTAILDNLGLKLAIETRTVPTSRRSTKITSS